MEEDSHTSLEDVKRLRVAAILADNLDELKRLVSRGNVDLPLTPEGKTAYKLAKEHHHADMARWLATQGARLDDDEIGRLVSMSLNHQPPSGQVQELLANASELFLKGNYTRALQVYREARTLQTSYLGPKHPDVQSTLGLLARTHQKLGQLEAALELLVQCRKVQLEILGPKSPVYLHTLRSISSVYFDQGRIKEAIGTLEPCVAGLREVLGLHSTDALAAAKLLDDYKRLAHQQPILAPKKVGRNDPCSCGSGKKSKKCHPPN